MSDEEGGNEIKQPLLAGPAAESVVLEMEEIDRTPAVMIVGTESEEIKRLKEQLQQQKSELKQVGIKLRLSEVYGSTDPPLTLKLKINSISN